MSTHELTGSCRQELEALLEKDIISYESYESIHALLPAEASLNGGGHTPASAAAKVASPPTGALSNLSIAAADNNQPPPPSYNQTTTTAPPALPARGGGPPPPPPSKPVIAHAKALYRYAATDARDVALERDDRVAVYEYMNADWWMGRNERTLQEGIFPRTYVEVVPAVDTYASEKAAAPYGQPVYAPSPAQNGYGGYPPPPGQQNPYNSSAPPVAIANEPQQQQEGQAAGGGKAGEMGKKFGKKLGNAAIFGAGASIGSNIVNSIF